MATNNGFPKQSMGKLNDRKKKCQKELETICNDIVHEPLAPVLSFPPHSNIPFIANCLELRRNREYGRHIVANVDLSVGQVIAVEESFCATLESNFNHQRCTNCMQEKFFNLIPCERCTVAMFCSQSCAKEADQSFHRIECALIDFISAEKNTLRIIRPVIHLISSVDFDSLRSFMNDPEKDHVNVFNLNGAESDERYKAIHSLEKNELGRSKSELFDFAVMGAFIYQGLITHSPLSELLKTDADKKLLMELIFHYYQIVPTNTIPFFDLTGILPYSNDDVYGKGLFGFLGLLNHSCAPNCCYVSFNRHTALIVSRPIKAGKQIFISYGCVKS